MLFDRSGSSRRFAQLIYFSLKSLRSLLHLGHFIFEFLKLAVELVHNSVNLAIPALRIKKQSV